MMQRWLTTLNSFLQRTLLAVGLLLIRVCFGLAMLLGHGIDKVRNFGAYRQNFPDPIGLGSTLSLTLCLLAEVACAGLLALGLLTRLAAVPLIINMAVAAFVVHGSAAWAEKELAYLYLFAYTTIFLTGPGPFALDSVFTLRSKQ